MTRRQLLLQARDLLDREGWVQGVLHQPGAGRCAVGAVIGVLDSGTADCDSPALSRTLFWNTMQALEAHLNQSLVPWNNDPRRTKREVLDLFDQVIACEPPEFAALGEARELVPA